MFSIFTKKPESLLIVKVNGKEICRINATELPCEKTPSVNADAGSAVEFIDCQGVIHKHELGEAAGWYHFSIRVYPNLACQADCVITGSEQFDTQALAQGKANGIRIQPFFISGAKVPNEELHGKGLFSRGLHFNGTVTSSNVVLSCECDRCHQSFQIHSFHVGFSNSGYFYSASGKYTITVGNHVPGCPAALSTPDPSELSALEAALPLAPDGTRFRYANPFRCPHCAAPYIDFEGHPEIRPGEYYGNYFVGSQLLKYEHGNG